MKTHLKNPSLLSVLIATLSLTLVGRMMAQTFTTLHSFEAVDTNGVNSDGVLPNSLVLPGNTLYGTASYGGSWGNGTIFALNTDGTGFKTLYAFSLTSTGGTNSDGASPNNLILSDNNSNGNLYGTTYIGGNAYGTVFRVSTNGILTSLYSFTGGNDGIFPSGLVQGSDGNFYGTTATLIDAGTLPDSPGTVFRISTNGVLTSLSSLANNNVGFRNGNRLVQGNDGNLYGTTPRGGTNSSGTVFKISTNGVLTTLYSFTGGTDGANPTARLVQGIDGNFYGTTPSGGNTNLNNGYGYGTVFKISTNGTLTTLHSFTGTDGSGSGGLVQASDGSFYGTTPGGGAYTNQYGEGYGTVFKISTSGVPTSLYSFGSVQDTNGFPLDGANPCAELVQGRDGNFYGTTSTGGAGRAGTVFRLTIVPPPQLAIIPTKANIVLTWRTNATEYTLQLTTNLISPVWTTNSAVPVVVNGLNTVTNPISGRQQFFRLKQVTHALL
jgi:uncharacterized repeat protein (TIGR03803 family)